MRTALLLIVIVIASGFLEINEKQQKNLQHLLMQEIHDGGNFQAADPKAIANIDFIFSGYNLFLGNPITWRETSDPGFTGRNIFLTSYSKKQVTSDGRHKIPDNLNVITKKGCKYNFESFVIKNTEQIQNYMSSFIGVNLVSNIDITPWAFTASSEFNHMQQKIEQTSATFVISMATCQIAQITQVPELAEFHQSFIDQLSALPVEYSAPQYLEFLSNFGTHYATDIILGSKVGYVYTLPPAIVDDFDQKKFKEIDLKQAATITSALLKGVIGQQILPKEQEAKAYSDVSKLSTQSFTIEIGPQSTENTPKDWLRETELEPTPIRYTLKSISELVSEGKGQLSSVKEYQKIGQNLKKALTDYCNLLQLQGERNGKCETNKREIGQWVEQRKVCLNFLKDCDWSGASTQICGNKNPIQKIGMDLPDVQANSVKFHSDKTVILGVSKFKRDKNQDIVIASFHNDYLFLDKPEICLINQGMSASAEYPIYLTDTAKCVVVLLWNACEGEVFYFTSVICNQMDFMNAQFELLGSMGKCEIALLDIRYPNSAQLRICLFKEPKLEGQKACFTNENKDAYFGQEFKSMMIEENEVMIHRSMPGSIAIQFG
ncbi:unnamed protein product (macronuclear) [Paramecium tetraurelia]|uniref:MACPF domain-containing protein n=1 Tax=Paramecium tetraurelia TaxID=5888 RepID=A0BCZ0_PARTE|nr:uncharacterized protein GSPATT00004501001 [Paramecium tetraurelia]CAK56407.1 unnamed protein product [Paramecium tetraurelia]|eukprot:XP_001423805.1 hypothetical protein (macronuclear) [Paramecium tetraurelia strain d4-2]